MHSKGITVGSTHSITASLRVDQYNIGFFLYLTYNLKQNEANIMSTFCVVFIFFINLCKPLSQVASLVLCEAVGRHTSMFGTILQPLLVRLVRHVYLLNGLVSPAD